MHRILFALEVALEVSHEPQLLALTSRNPALGWPPVCREPPEHSPGKTN